jgi:hypothetical protein
MLSTTYYSQYLYFIWKLRKATLYGDPPY